MAISLSKNGNAIVFTFDDNDHYLGNGEISVPVNSLTLVTDESDMFTFYKAASNDIFISGLYSQIGKSKSELIAWYKDNMVGSTGVTPEEVQDMIDESTSGLAESSAVTEEISEAVSGKADSSAVTEEISAAVSGKADSSAVTQEISAAVSGKADLASAVTDIRVQDILYGRALQYKKGDGGYSTKTYFGKINDSYIVDNNNNNIPNFSLVETSAVTSSITSSSTNSQVAGAKAVYDAIGDKADSSVVNTLSGKVDTNEEVVSRALNTLNTNKADLSAMTVALSGKQDTLSAGTNITISGNVISAEGGGKAISGGTNISVTTGETADTVNCTLPISANTSNKNVTVGYDLDVREEGETSIGKFNLNRYESAIKHSGNTIFTVGNGGSNGLRHNALEIRKNGDLYFADTSNNSQSYYQKPMVKLQDMYAALGGLKLVQLTQAEYDALVSGGTVDASTLYIITNVVS